LEAEEKYDKYDDPEFRAWVSRADWSEIERMTTEERSALVETLWNRFQQLRGEREGKEAPPQP
jgi:hypothetical protein